MSDEIETEAENAWAALDPRDIPAVGETEQFVYGLGFKDGFIAARQRQAAWKQEQVSLWEERARLLAQVEQLRSFEREYRARLRSYFTEQIERLS